MINVIETVDGAINSNRLFKDKKKAEACFAACVREHEDNAGLDFIDSCLDDGIYDDECGYVVMISHPEIIK